MSPSTYKVSLIHKSCSNPASEAAGADIRKILDATQKTRTNISFEARSTTSTAGNFLANSAAGHAVEGRDGAIFFGSYGSHGIRIPGFVRVSHLTVPTPALVPKASSFRGTLADLDVKVLFQDPAASESDAEHLVSTGTAVARWTSPPANFTVAGNLTGTLSKLPSARTTHVSSQRLLQSFAQEPTSLNGVIVTDEETGLALIALAESFVGVHASQAYVEPEHATLFQLQLPEQNLQDGYSAVSVTFAVRSLLQSLGLLAEAQALSSALQRTLDPIAYVGSNLLPASLGGTTSDSSFIDAVIRDLAFFLEAVNSQEQEVVFDNRQISDTTRHSKPMNVVEKIITNAATSLAVPEVSAGDFVCVRVEWILTSELLWGGMEKTYDQMKRPRLNRNDRVWLAVDHTVDPRSKTLPKQRKLIERAERFRDETKIINFLPANTSIMHTDFTREKAQPGTIVVGTDSHTCSAGSMGSLAVGFGAADTAMPLVTGQTWFRVPEVCRIEFVGKPAYGISGKDVILHILGLFKRNTIAFQRAVEYGGPSLHKLSMDARFAIANMTTEFGGMGACFEADDLTASWISRRRFRQDRSGGKYFRPDARAAYAEKRTINLSQVAFTVAIHPNPDDVVPISEKIGLSLNGCFIGACTTTEEELVLAALVLDAGLRSGMVPTAKGKRVVTPGSLIISNQLDELGLLDVYRRAGFEIGAPGCSYCVGIDDVNVAQEGEVWLSSQNRNFRNRMGKGSIGNITSAAAVAVSSFDMRVTDPKALMSSIKETEYKTLELRLEPRPQSNSIISIEEPRPQTLAPQSQIPGFEDGKVSLELAATLQKASITGKIQRFGENVDT